jgi:hypothetical protein
LSCSGGVSPSVAEGGKFPTLGQRRYIRRRWRRGCSLCCSGGVSPSVVGWGEVSDAETAPLHQDEVEARVLVVL